MRLQGEYTGSVASRGGRRLFRKLPPRGLPVKALAEFRGEANEEGPQGNGDQDQKDGHLGHLGVALIQGQAPQDQVELPPGNQVEGAVEAPLPPEPRLGPAQVVEGKFEGDARRARVRAQGASL